MQERDRQDVSTGATVSPGYEATVAPPPIGTATRLIARLVVIAVVVATLFLTVSALLVNVGDVFQHLRGFSVPSLIAIMAAVLLNYALRFAKWTWFLRCVEVSIPVTASLSIFLSAFTMVLSPGKLGELMKAWLMKARFGVPIARTAAVVMAERLTDLLGLTVLAGIGATRFAYGGGTLVVTLIIVIGGTLLITREWFWRWCDTFVLARFAALHRFRPGLRMLEESTHNLLSLRSLLLTVPLSAVSWAGEGVALYLIFRSLAVDIPDLMLVALFAHAFSSIVGALSFVPGGLFVTEGALGVFFVLVGIDRARAVVSTLLIRGVTLWFAVGLGTAVLVSSGALRYLARRKLSGEATRPVQ